MAQHGTDNLNLITDIPGVRVGHAHDATAALRQAGVMRHQDKRCLSPPLQVEQQVDDMTAGLAVEIACRLVGEENLRVGTQGASQRHALLLPSGELGREMIYPVRQPDLVEHGAGRVEGIGSAGKLEGKRDIFECRHRRHQVK